MSDEQTGPEATPAVLRLRSAERQRVTRETEVTVALALDASAAEVAASTIASGVPFFDHLLAAFARHGRFALQARARGDTEIDDHHTVEDVGLVLGQTLLEALGERRGIARFGSAYAPMDEALARVVIDLSGRPYTVYAAEAVRLPERVGHFETQLVPEFWRAFATEARLTLHADLLRGQNGHHALEALFKAAGLALRAAVTVDLRDFSVPSTKGVL